MCRGRGLNCRLLSPWASTPPLSYPANHVIKWWQEVEMHGCKQVPMQLHYHWFSPNVKRRQLVKKVPIHIFQNISCILSALSSFCLKSNQIKSWTFLRLSDLQTISRTSGAVSTATPSPQWLDSNKKHKSCKPIAFIQFNTPSYISGASYCILLPVIFEWLFLYNLSFPV